METIISVSILNANFLALGDFIRQVEAAGADRLHIDVMDGNFVPNISFGFPVIESIRGATSLPLDVHLMIDRPERYVERFVRAGAHTLGFHYEAGSDAGSTLEMIRKSGARPSITICPATPVHVLFDLLPFVSQVLVMTVQPGYGGQTLMEPCLEKIRRLREECERRSLRVDIEADGGIDSTNAPLVKQAGANVLVVGSAITMAEDMAGVIRSLR